LFICACVVLPMYASAKEHRSTSVKREFQLTHPYPATGCTSGPWPGYVKDHVLPLACGGPDAVSNLQWQTIRDAKAKDKWEMKGCVRSGELLPSRPGHHEIDLAATAPGTYQSLAPIEHRSVCTASGGHLHAAC
jgi:hypothetical protein